MSCFVIAEAGVNHNGSEDLARQLIDAAVAASADAVKFQTFKAEKLVTLSADKASYQKENTGSGDQYSMLRALELSDDAHRRLADYCEQRGIEFMSTAFDEESADFLVGLGIRRIKVPSGELTNLPFIRYLAEKGLPMILSTGMAEMDEVAEAVEVVLSTTHELLGDAADVQLRLAILHCTSNYPAALDEVNLRAMLSMAERFQLPVGYSDHTKGCLVSPMAVAMGAVIIEKHFTLDRNLPGPDHAASLEPNELSDMIADIRSVELALGSAEKKPTKVEMEVRKAARRSITLNRDVRAGESITREDLVLLRPGTGISPRNLPEVIGRTTRSDMVAGETLQWDDLSK